MTAILAVPELPPLPESQPETTTDESPEAISFATILAAIDVPPANEGSDEENDWNETAALTVTPAADSLPFWFRSFEPISPEVESSPAVPAPARGGVVDGASQSDAGADSIREPLIFALEVQPASLPEIPAAPESNSPALETGDPEPDATAVLPESGPQTLEPPDIHMEAVAELPARPAEEGEFPEPGVEPAEISPDSAPAAPMPGHAKPMAPEPAQPWRPDNRLPAVREPALTPELPQVIEPRRVEVRIEPQENVAAPPVDVVVSQRGASLHFSVHSADGRLGAEMRQSLGDLTERLEVLGYRAAPPAAAEPAQAVQEPAATEGQWSDSGGSPGSAYSGQEKRQGRRDRNQWRLEMESQSTRQRSAA